MNDTLEAVDAVVNAPKLRFPEFEGNWEEKNIEKVCDTIGGFAFKSTNFKSSGIPVIRISDLDASSKSIRLSNCVSHKEDHCFAKYEIGFGDVLIALSGATTGKVATYQNKAKAYLNQRVGLFKIKDRRLDCYEFIKQFLYSDLFERQLKKLLVAGAQPNISTQDLSKTKVYLPQQNEQQKIADFLSAVDSKIALLQDKRNQLQQYKKGAMQQLFSQQRRFTQADGSAYPDWQEKKLGDMAKKIKTKNTNGEVARVLTNSATQGVLDQRDYFDKDIANSSNLDNYYVINKGDYVYNPRTSVSAPVGPINKNTVGKGVMSPLYTVFRFKEKNNDFFQAYFQSSFWHKYVFSVANYGARHDRMNITSEDFLNMPLPYPYPEEQQKIADFLIALNSKIDVVSQQLAQMQDFKKGLLQQMFV